MKQIEVYIKDDPNPEPNEAFEIILASPKGGLTLGDPHQGNKLIIMLFASSSSICIFFPISDL